MPKRLNAAIARVPLTGSDPFESLESRRRRLFPDVQPPSVATPACSATERVGEVPSCARSSPPGARIHNRNDAPVQHTTRRGSRAKAAAAIRHADPEALIQELIVDRRSASGVDSAATSAARLATLPPVGSPPSGGAASDLPRDSRLYHQSRIAVQKGSLQVIRELFVSRQSETHRRPSSS